MTIFPYVRSDRTPPSQGASEQEPQNLGHCECETPTALPFQSPKKYGEKNKLTDSVTKGSPPKYTFLLPDFAFSAQSRTFLCDHLKYDSNRHSNT